MELDPWGSMPQHVLCPWQLDGNWNAKWSIFRWEDSHPTQQRTSSSSSLSLLPSPYQMKLYLRIHFHKTSRKIRFKTQKRIYANLFFLRGFDNPNKGILDFNWLICPLSWFQTDPSFGASDRQILAEDDVNGNHGAWTACSWGSFKRPSVFWEEFLELPRSSLLPPKAIEMAGKNVSKISNWSERYHLDPSCWSVINPNSSSPIDYPSIFASIFFEWQVLMH